MYTTVEGGNNPALRTCLPLFFLYKTTRGISEIEHIYFCYLFVILSMHFFVLC